MSKAKRKTIPESVHNKALKRIEELEAKLQSKPEAKSANGTGVKKHLQCPLCWGGYGGRAQRMKWHRQVSGRKQKRCYVCGECGTEWVVEVDNLVVDDGVSQTITKVTEVRGANSSVKNNSNRNPNKPSRQLP